MIQRYRIEDAARVGIRAVNNEIVPLSASCPPR
jgi:hypothetical protein